MSRRNRRSTRTRGAQFAPGAQPPATAKELQKPGVARISQARTGKPLKQGPDLNRQLGNLGSDIRRIFICAGICAAVLVAVYFLVR